MEQVDLERVILKILQHNLSEVSLLWLEEKASQVCDEKEAAYLNKAFVTAHRNVGRSAIEVPQAELDALENLLPGYAMDGFTVDRLCRIYLLLQVNKTDKENYIHKIETLFNAAEMNELAALYAALPFLAYPSDWIERCAEGIRSNIGIVLEAIMYNNPYPSTFLADPAWNQMVLKAFFTEKDINKIYGIDERSNEALAATLIDYAHERLSAHRSVNPQLWRLVTKFINADNLVLIENLFISENEKEKQAGALACFYSSYEPANRLLANYPQLKAAITNHTLTWNNM